MPNNTPVWGQQNYLGKYHYQDLKTLIEQERNQDEEAGIIKVNDVNDGISEKIAVHAINSSTDADARALKIEGMSEIVANVDANNDTIGLLLKNQSNGPDSRAIKANGIVEVQKRDGGGELDAPQLKIGQCFLNTDPDGDDIHIICSDNTRLLTITPNQQTKAVWIDGGLYVRNAGADIYGPFRANGSTTLESNFEAQGLSTFQQKVTMEDELEVADNVSLQKGLEVKLPQNYSFCVKDSNNNVVLVINSDGDVNISRGTRTATVQGTLVVLENAAIAGYLSSNQGASLRGATKIGPTDGPGEIDSGGVNEQNQCALHIGAGAGTGNIELSKSGKSTKIKGSMVVEEDSYFESEVYIGHPTSPGKIDSGGSEFTPKNLQIGSGVVTANVEISRSDKNTTVKGSLTVDEDVSLSGRVITSLKVGPDNNPGLVDSRGTEVSPQDLKIGTATTTKNVVLGNGSKIVDFNNQARMNENEVVMNDAASLTAASGLGFVANTDGHGGHGPAIDFYAA